MQELLVDRPGSAAEPDLEGAVLARAAPQVKLRGCGEEPKKLSGGKTVKPQALRGCGEEPKKLSGGKTVKPQATRGCGEEPKKLSGGKTVKPQATKKPLSWSSSEEVQASG
jgi:hypothetical protein